MKIKSIIVSFVSVLCCSTAIAQNIAGITGVKDIGFTNESALKSVQKNFPNAKIALAVNAELVNAAYDVQYCEQNGYPLFLDVFSPKQKSAQTLPAIIMIHGGGWRTGDKSQHHELAKALAMKGYVVFTPAYRLSTVALFPAAVVDAKTAIKWVKAHAKAYGIDKGKIGLAGYSAGGQMAAFIGATAENTAYESEECLFKESATVKAVVDIDGILAFIHPESGEGDDSKSTSAATHYFGFTKEENPALWIEAGALNHVNAGSPPILFINSGVDRMHAGREDYIARLDTYGIYSEVHTFVNAPHVFPLLDLWFEQTVELIDNFLAKHLK